MTNDVSKFMTVGLDMVNYTGEALRHLAVAGHSLPTKEVNNLISVDVSTLISRGVDVATHNGPLATGMAAGSHQVIGT